GHRQLCSFPTRRSSDRLAMLCLRYDEEAGRDMAARIARAMRDAAYAASVALAREKGAFPALDVERYLAPGTFASRLDPELQAQIDPKSTRLNSSHVKIS